MGYLDALPADGSPVLLFIVPHERMYGLWRELKEKCYRNAVELENETTADAISWAQTGRLRWRSRVGNTSWERWSKPREPEGTRLFARTSFSFAD